MLLEAAALFCNLLAVAGGVFCIGLAVIALFCLVMYLIRPRPKA